MAAVNQTLKCPVCHGALTYTPENGNFTCIYCDGQFTLEDLRARGVDVDIASADSAQEGRVISDEEKKYTRADDDSVYDVEDTAKLVAYTCSHCQAEVITGANTAATTCVYCGQAIVLTSQLVNDLSPEGVVPFKTTEEQARAEFLKFAKKPLTPRDFIKQVEVQKVQGVYAPFWLYSGRVEGTETGTGTLSYSRGDSDYTCTAEFYRSGYLKFADVPVDSSSRIDNDAMDSIEPFDLSEMQPFSPMYLTGFLAERYDEDAKTCYPRLEERVTQSLSDFLEDDVKAEMEHRQNHSGSFSTSGLKRNMNIPDCDAKYIMYPVWLLYCQYNDKKYLFAMNGQTGKFIGNLPCSKLKLFLMSGGAGILTSVIVWLITMLS